MKPETANNNTAQERLVRHLSEAHSALKEARIDRRIAEEAESAAEGRLTELKNKYLEIAGEEWDPELRCRECKCEVDLPEFTEAGNGPFCGPCFKTYRAKHA